MDILSQFDDDVTEINISHKNIVGELDFSRFTKLKSLNCNNNKITNLDNLPNSLQRLYCGFNNITNLDNLPNSLQRLNCGFNKITNYYELIKKI